MQVANPFVRSAPVLHPFHRPPDGDGRHIRRLTERISLSEHEPIELARFRLVDLGHEVPVAVERRLDRCVAELGLDADRKSVV